MAIETGLETAVGRVRLEISDQTEPAEFSDAEVQLKLDANGADELLAAADLCGILAIRYAKKIDHKTDGQEFKFGPRAQRFADLEKELRDRAGGTIGVIETTRIDGASEDVSAREGAGDGGGRSGIVRRGYSDPDPLQ